MEKGQAGNAFSPFPIFVGWGEGARDRGGAHAGRRRCLCEADRGRRQGRDLLLLSPLPHTPMCSCAAYVSACKRERAQMSVRICTIERKNEPYPQGRCVGRGAATPGGGGFIETVMGGSWGRADHNHPSQ